MIYLYKKICITFRINADFFVYGIKLMLFLSPITYQYIIFMHISLYNIIENLHDLSV
jgi:hypothetical protein